MSDSDPIALHQAIKKQACKLGFELFGITTPDPPSHYGVFENWLAAGRHGEMDYLASARSRLRRADPRLILPECRSILVLGMRYSSPENISPVTSTDSSRLTGKIAAYAWGEDYHDVLPIRLSSLVDFIEHLVGRPVPNRWYTDSGPLMERELAQRAGLGWIGKNTCLIHPAEGSYFLLAEILLGLDLEPDIPFAFDRCGSCTRCVDACPTGCILPDRTIDARRCISYLTIELKGSIPEPLRLKVGEWVFGCDICQQVCPWNQHFSIPDGAPSLAARKEMQQPNLLTELTLTESEFKQRSKNSPLRRPKRRGYLRNVAVSLGCARDGRAAAALENALFDPEPLVRSHSAWALGQIGGEEAERMLRSARGLESDAQVLEEITGALQHFLLKDGSKNRAAAR